MGVTVHFFAFDPKVLPEPPTMDRLLAWEALDREMVVADGARGWLREYGTVLGDNKKWYGNLCGDFAWSCARDHVAPDARAEIDRWLSHLFWDADGTGCPCGRAPTPVAPHEVIYDAALMAHILSLECSLLPLEQALPIEFDGDPPASPRLHRDTWIYDFDGFCWLVWQWQELFERVQQQRPGWSLLRWVWY